MGTFPLHTNIVLKQNIPSILMTGYLLGTFPLDTAGMAVYTYQSEVVSHGLTQFTSGQVKQDAARGEVANV